jgi:hypothetical protein
MVDLNTALGITQKAFLHELTAGVHTENFSIPKDSKGKLAWSSEGKFGFGLHAGLVELPRVPQFGALGGKMLYVSAAAVYGNREDGWQFKAAYRRNDPELLALFPYAQNASNLLLQVTGDFK